MQRTQLGDQPPAGTPEQMVDGSVAPQLPQSQAPREQEEPDDLSSNARKRISELTAHLREKDRALQQALEESQRYGSSLKELEAKYRSLEDQRNSFLQSHLDELDPETRSQVMMDAKLNEQLASFRQRLMDELMPHLQGLQQQNVHREMMELGKTYPAFDIQIHGPLIDMFRGKNPNCTVEQAYRAIAEPEELVTRAQASATAVPPIAPPGNGSPTLRYQPQPQANSDPIAEMREEAALVRKLRMSSDPAEQREGIRLAERNIARRLADRLPGG